MQIIEILVENKVLQVLAIFLAMDTIFGVLRSFKEHRTNSTIGIDGIVRKIAMLTAIVICIIIDFIVKIDFVNFIPEDIRVTLSIGQVGLSYLFGMLYCLFEVLSIFKNMIKIGIPLPIKLKKFLEKLLKEYTKEIKEGEINDK